MARRSWRRLRRGRLDRRDLDAADMNLDLVRLRGAGARMLYGGTAITCHGGGRRVMKLFIDKGGYRGMEPLYEEGSRRMVDRLRRDKQRREKGFREDVLRAIGGARRSSRSLLADAE
jgi:hypothetical protein